MQDWTPCTPLGIAEEMPTRNYLATYQRREGGSAGALNRTSNQINKTIATVVWATHRGRKEQRAKMSPDSHPRFCSSRIESGSGAVCAISVRRLHAIDVRCWVTGSGAGSRGVRGRGPADGGVSHSQRHTLLSLRDKTATRLSGQREAGSPSAAALNYKVREPQW